MADAPAADSADDSVAGRAADLALALSLADAADAISKARFRAADLVVESKPDLTPVSDADRAVEQAIRSVLARERPADAIHGEEFGADAPAPGVRRWVIDPIDGTKNYVRGVPVWATLIGLLDGDEVTVGVVSAPALGRRWWAATGSGSWVVEFGAQPRRLAVSQVAAVSDGSVSYASLTGWDGRPGFERLLAQAWRTRAYGDFWSYMLVAEGAVDVAAEPELELYDMAALAPIVTEAGGRFSGVDGVDGVLRGNALATNGRLHDEVLTLLNG